MADCSIVITFENNSWRLLIVAERAGPSARPFHLQPAISGTGEQRMVSNLAHTPSVKRAHLPRISTERAGAKGRVSCKIRDAAALTRQNVYWRRKRRPNLITASFISRWQCHGSRSPISMRRGPIRSRAGTRPGAAESRKHCEPRRTELLSITSRSGCRRAIALHCRQSNAPLRPALKKRR